MRNNTINDSDVQNKNVRRIRTGKKFVPFAWQEKAALKHIRTNCEDYGSTLAVYSALTVIASDMQADEFQTTHNWLSMQSGFSIRTVQSRLRELERLKLVAISTPKLKCPSTYRLLPFGNGCRTFGKREALAIADIRSKSGSKSGSKSRQGHAISKSRCSPNRFPATADEVFEFGSRQDCDEFLCARFIRYNNSCGWMMDGKPMYSWEAALLKFKVSCEESPANNVGEVPHGWIPEIIQPEGDMDIVRLKKDAVHS